MKALRLISVILLLILTASAYAAAAPSRSSKPGKDVKIKAHAAGELFCPTASLVLASTTIAPRRCYLVYVVRDSGGTFLAFADQSAKIPKGQIVRMNTAAGAKLKGRIFYVIPLRTSAALVPMNSMTLIAFRAEDYGSRVTLILTSAAARNLSVTFAVKL